MAGSTKRQQPTCNPLPFLLRRTYKTLHFRLSAWLVMSWGRARTDLPLEVRGVRKWGNSMRRCCCCCCCIAVVKTSSWILDLGAYKFLCGKRGEEGEVRLGVRSGRGREGGRKAAFCARFYPAPTDPVIRRERLSALPAPVGFSPSHLARLSRPPSQLFLCLSFFIVEVQGLQT